mmetsp:Transcript_10949/g.21424  ORF Transcript_10949/g.21424 Transcript_10949/m.21424 type:complete len:279 (+) Transcript_10949:68-904(+)
MHSPTSTSEERLTNSLRLLVSSESKALYESFGASFLRALLESSRDNYFNSNIVREDEPYFRGYPSGNFLKQLAQVFTMWSSRGEFPIKFVTLSAESTPEIVSKLNSFTPQVTALISTLDDPQSLAMLERLLLLLGPRGVLTCLGVRHTPGSVDKYCLPTRAALERAFGQRHSKEESKGSNLTVGARALTKHCHRSSEGFWGKIRGTEETLNQQALGVMNRLLNNCVWVNLHCLPKGEAIVEVRVGEGYGARWYVLQQQSFRGFVEPMMEGGHDKRWRH